MRLTNKFGLPDAILRAVRMTSYSRGDADYSVTQLLKPPRAAALESQHAADLEEDVSDRVWSLLGQAVHVVAERANEIGLAEKRLSTKIDGMTISGGMDLYLTDGTLIDYKTTSVHNISDGVPLHWEQQLNSYAEILRQNNLSVTKLTAIAILRDWSKSKAKKDENYPQVQIISMDISLWPQEKAIAFLKERIELHERAKIELPECSSEERWERRQGQHARCEGYCLAAPFCEQFKNLKKFRNKEIFPVRRTLK